MTHDQGEAHNEGEPTVARSERAADSALDVGARCSRLSRSAPAEGPIDAAQPFPSRLALRNATRVGQASATCTPGLSEVGASIVAFAELVAVMRVTGNLVDGDVLQGLIVRVAELLDETLPPGP